MRKSQKSKNASGHSVRFDLFSDDANRTLYGAEIQLVSAILVDGTRKKRFPKEELVS